MKNGTVRLAAALSVAAPFLLAGNCTASSSSGWDLSNVSGYGLPNAAVSDIIKNVLEWLLAMFGIIGVIGFLIAGVMYLVSAGDEDMAKRAKRGMTFSIIGIIIGLAGLVIIKAAEAILKASSSF